jgi:hypothetical protein
MKVYSVPEAVPFAEPDYKTYDWKAEQAREERHMADLKKHLVEMGYKGKHTGKIVRFGVADGSAQYMLADGKGVYGPSFLIHLPYGDAYHQHMVQHMPKKAIVEQIERQEKLASLFAKKDAA